VTLRVIVLLVIALLVVRAIRLLIGGIMIGAGSGTGDGAGRSRGPTPMKLVRDPVCGTHVAPRPSLSLTSGGTTHYFCSEECRRRFKA
jgi:YHS domain-containing protein